MKLNILFSLPSVRLVFRQFYWQFCLYHSSLITRFLDCQEHYWYFIYFISKNCFKLCINSGRFMVGLRWWNYIDNNGESQWVFESRPSEQEQSFDKLSSTEIYIFWAGLVAAPAVWVRNKI